MTTDVPEPDPAEQDQPDDAAARARRKARLDRIFGDVLPDETGDERGPGSGGAGATDRDAEIKRDVPPHHG